MTKLKAVYTWEIPVLPKISYKTSPTCSPLFDITLAEYMKQLLEFAHMAFLRTYLFYKHN